MNAGLGRRKVRVGGSAGGRQKAGGRRDLSSLERWLKQFPSNGNIHECSLLQPVDVEQPLGKEPRPVDLYERVEVAERGDHQVSLSTAHRDVIRQTVRFPCGTITRQREDYALSNEMRRGIILVQICEDWSERIARVQFLRGLRILGHHVNHEVGVPGKESHLSLRVATIGAMGVSLDDFPDRKAIRAFCGRDGDVLAHESSP
jgi:hypothetical protein